MIATSTCASRSRFRSSKLQSTFTTDDSTQEQNLLHLSFHTGAPSSSGPVVSFLSQSPQETLLLHPRAFNITTRSFVDLAKATDVVCPLDPTLAILEDTDFNEIPFSCPAAQRILPIPTEGTEKFALIMGDEYAVLYSIAFTPSSPRASRLSISSTTATSPRASATRRSPQTELTNIGKRRKSSIGSSSDRWEVKPVWRTRQGFGTVLAASVIESRQNGASVIMGDDSGQLTGITWDFGRDSGADSVHVKKIDLGIVGQPTCLC
jgi:DNA damage-binding protein 1